MIKREHLTVPVVGVASRAGTSNSSASGPATVSETTAASIRAFEKLCGLLRYVDGDYGDPATFQPCAGTSMARPRPRLLAIPHDLRTRDPATGESGLFLATPASLWKTLGRDLASAVLNQILLSVFDEKSIFRIDHYLGKAPVRNCSISA